jgi:hypothetical protein
MRGARYLARKRQIEGMTEEGIAKPLVAGAGGCELLQRQTGVPPPEWITRVGGWTRACAGAVTFGGNIEADNKEIDTGLVLKTPGAGRLAGAWSVQNGQGFNDFHAYRDPATGYITRIVLYPNGAATGRREALAPVQIGALEHASHQQATHAAAMRPDGRRRLWRLRLVYDADCADGGDYLRDIQGDFVQQWRRADGTRFARYTNSANEPMEPETVAEIRHEEEAAPTPVPAEAAAALEQEEQQELVVMDETETQAAPMPGEGGTGLAPVPMPGEGGAGWAPIAPGEQPLEPGTEIGPAGETVVPVVQAIEEFPETVVTETKDGVTKIETTETTVLVPEAEAAEAAAAGERVFLIEGRRYVAAPSHSGGGGGGASRWIGGRRRTRNVWGGGRRKSRSRSRHMPGAPGMGYNQPYATPGMGYKPAGTPGMGYKQPYATYPYNAQVVPRGARASLAFGYDITQKKDWKWGKYEWGAVVVGAALLWFAYKWKQGNDRKKALALEKAGAAIGAAAVTGDAVLPDPE